MFATSDTLLPFTLIIVSAGIAPGPTNMLLLSAGVQRGLSPSIPLILGAMGGIFFVFHASWQMVGFVLQIDPRVSKGFSLLALAFMAWLALKLALSAVSPGVTSLRTSVADMALLQLLNPMEWVVLSAAAIAYLPNAPSGIDMAAASLLVLCVTIPLLLAWVGIGAVIGNVAGSYRVMRWTSLASAAVILVSVISVVPGLATPTD